MKRLLPILIAVLVCGYGARSVFGQESASVLYVPLIGITSVPNPLVLPNGEGEVTYHYAVKNFLQEVPLSDVWVVDDSCGPVVFLEGDDNGDSLLDYSETWRYSCATNLSVTTYSTATATGTANNITATHNAYATVIVGSDSPAPLVSIVNITKVAYPLSLPSSGGEIVFTYKVSNPGVVPLAGVAVTDDKCNVLSGKLGDRNGNNLLDMHEVWIYTCTATLTQTTTNTAIVTAHANGSQAVGYATTTVTVAVPSFPNTGAEPAIKIIIWGVLTGILAALVVFKELTKK